MVELVKYLVTELTGSEDCAEVGFESELNIRITIEKEHMGKVLGKQGKVINSIRTLVRAAGMKENKRYTVEVVEKV